MRTYTAEFHTWNACAVHDIEADTAEQALQLAQALYRDDGSNLDWCRYDLNWRPLESIEIEEQDGDDAVAWRSEEEILADAARDLLDALVELVGRERAEAAASGFTDDEMTWLEAARRAIAKAKGS